MRIERSSRTHREGDRTHRAPVTSSSLFGPGRRRDAGPKERKPFGIRANEILLRWVGEAIGPYRLASENWARSRHGTSANRKRIDSASPAPAPRELAPAFAGLPLARTAGSHPAFGERRCLEPVERRVRRDGTARPFAGPAQGRRLPANLLEQGEVGAPARRSGSPRGGVRRIARPGAGRAIQGIGPRGRPATGPGGTRPEGWVERLVARLTDPRTTVSPAVLRTVPTLGRISRRDP